MQDACAGKTLAEQIAYCYDLPLGQARGIAAMIAAERERCAKLIESQFTEARDTEFDLGFETARKELRPPPRCNVRPLSKNSFCRKMSYPLK